MSQPEEIKLGIVGYGNLGKGVELAIRQNPDMELVGIFSRRSPETVKSQAKVFSYREIEKYKKEIDILILCGGSATDLPGQTAELNKSFNTIDSFDTHPKIPTYFASVDASARAHNTLSLISTGWDPGLFSLIRVISESFLPAGKTYTFWGRGVSQGHSNAIKKINGVKNAVQYTVPDKAAVEEIRNGTQPNLSSADMHNRVCYVVAEEGADKSEIEKKIKSMPDYFAPYHTEVHFISEQELSKDHSHMQHGGRVIRSGITGRDTNQHLEFSLNLESNPEFTANILVACARAVVRLRGDGKMGAISIFDIPVGYLSPYSPEELRKRLL